MITMHLVITEKKDDEEKGGGDKKEEERKGVKESKTVILVESEVFLSYSITCYNLF
jgi:hypothetical protein